MSRRKGRDGRSRRSGKDDDEVETLVRAAEDELLLNLSIDSHVAARGSSSSSSSLDPDLLRRFQALRSPPPPRQHPKEPSGSADEPDLFARFAALKEKDKKKGLLDESVVFGPYDEVDEDDEVAKVMRWAVDAARLDPGDDDDEFEVSSCSTSDDDDGDDDDEEDQKRRKEPKNKKKQNAK